MFISNIHDFKCDDLVSILTILIYTSVQASSGTKKCELCVKSVLLESICAHVVFDVLRNTSRTAWRWRRHKLKRVGVKKW
jgi:hypothetical protein